eukprot:TRINITY_DN6614_c0_g1_i2.p2 TRINITY_DN6614_c0_g1~~TRINITY_DN6614_c0_g1_i2.p2  ORF type:complete len:168 (-),score=1.64 TRINITY_DN6614_c0_g1_i2:132-635(-)
MGGVDLIDSVKGRAKRTLQTRRWNLKVFNYLLEISIYNVFVLQKKCGKKVGTYREFKRRLSSQLINLGTRQNDTNKCKNDPDDHFPDQFDTARDCFHCSTQAKRKRTTYKCVNCGVFLCAFPCFRNFHKKKTSVEVPLSPRGTSHTGTPSRAEKVKRNPPISRNTKV